MNKSLPTLLTNVSDTASHRGEGAVWLALRSVIDRYLPIASKLMLIFLVLYFAELANFPLSIDEEFAAYRHDPTSGDNPAVWVAQGRWAIYLIEILLLPQPTVPFLPVVLFGVSTVVAYLLLLRSHNFKEVNLQAYALFPLFSAFPIWFFIVEFYTNLPGIGLGLLASCLVVYYFAKLVEVCEHKVYFASSQRLAVSISVCATAIALACYQSFLFLIVSASLGTSLIRILNSPNAFQIFWKSIAVLAVVIIGGGLIYYLVWMSFLHFLGIPISYIQNLVDIGSLIEDPKRILSASLSEFWKIYSGSADVYGHNSMVGFLVLGGLLAAIVQLWFRGYVAFFVGAFLIAAVLLAPFALHPLSRGFAAYRSMVAVPYVVWLCGALSLNWATWYLRVVGAALIGLVIFGSLYSFSLFQAANYSVRDHDRLLAQQLYARIAAANDKFDVNRPYLVEFFGGKRFQTLYPRVLSSTSGQSFFEWDGGNPYRIISFMKLIGYSNLKAIGTDRRANYLAEFNIMPVWPNEGSVKAVGDVTLVRLGQEPGLLHQNLNVPFRLEEKDVLYRLRNQQLITLPNPKKSMAFLPDGTLRINSQSDPQVTVPLNDAGARACRVLQVAITQQIKMGAAVQVFYQPAGEKVFSEKNSFRIYQPPGKKETTFFLQSESGFEPTLRIDPVHNRQPVNMHDIAVGCARRL